MHRPASLGCLLLLLPLLMLRAAALPGDAGLQQPSVEVFSFDYTWSPSRPVANDTVVFRATAGQPDAAAEWSLTDESFRWYQQLPGSGFHLRHVGRSYTRNASETYFEGRYRLRVLVEQKRPQQPPGQAWEGNLLVDVVKYVGLQKRVDIALLTNATANATGGNSSDRVLVCRFWGWPLVDSLQLLPAPGSLCDRQHFETAEAEPHIDLVVRCPRLRPGDFSCYGRNTVSASQLTCQLSGPDLTASSCYRPNLDEPETVASRDATSTGARSSESKSRQGFKAARSGADRTRGSIHATVAMATTGLAAVLAITR